MLRRQYPIGPHEHKTKGLQRKTKPQNHEEGVTVGEMWHILLKTTERKGHEIDPELRGPTTFITEGHIFKKKDTCKHKVDYKNEYLLTVKTYYKFLRS